jgi:hypothetical protein
MTYCKEKCEGMHYEEIGKCTCGGGVYRFHYPGLTQVQYRHRTEEKTISELSTVVRLGHENEFIDRWLIKMHGD